MSAPEGPFYIEQGVSQADVMAGDAYFRPEDLRFIKGKWRSHLSFEMGFGRDVLHEWENATTLQEYLEEVKA